ncbi:hypothetical protein QJS04_geneDACA012299 [Acorus gramineus]|uniref:Uncharacterized protein n=1 Tax=Acorus gramineus TaxID=55184 RepID=A0AAV8ZZH3_ACOGR|nr:hypothetical protein QJS04_geneDACA012299 [Acorus gramineus]
MKVIELHMWVDFTVVDEKRREEIKRILGAVGMGRRGAVVVCAGGWGTRIRWRGLVGEGRRIVRSVVLPIVQSLSQTLKKEDTKGRGRERRRRRKRKKGM